MRTSGPSQWYAGRGRGKEGAADPEHGPFGRGQSSRETLPVHRIRPLSLYTREMGRYGGSSSVSPGTADASTSRLIGTRTALRRSSCVPPGRAVHATLRAAGARQRGRAPGLSRASRRLRPSHRRRASRERPPRPAARLRMSAVPMEQRRNDCRSAREITLLISCNVRNLPS